MFEIVSTQHKGRPSCQQDCLFDGQNLIQSTDHHITHCILRTDSLVLAVADGVAISPSPEKASRACIDLLIKSLSGNPLSPKLLRQIHNQFCDQLAKGKTFGSSTTLVVIQIIDDVCTLLNVGDSRGYVIRADGRWEQLSYDHSIINGLIASGEADPDMEYAELYNGLDHCWVADFEEYDFAIHQSQIKLQTNDTILLCSDGVHDVLGDQLQQLYHPSAEIDDQVRTWREAILAMGAPDNLSLILAKVL